MFAGRPRCVSALITRAQPGGIIEVASGTASGPMAPKFGVAIDSGFRAKSAQVKNHSWFRSWSRADVVLFVLALATVVIAFIAARS